MNRKLLVLTASLVASSSFALPISQIPEKDRVVLKGDWAPTREQTQQALVAIEHSQQKPLPSWVHDRESLLKIRSGQLNYRVQFIGEPKNGQKSIRCNFFLPSVILLHGKPFLDWRKTQVGASDAGYEYWWDRYYPATGRVE